MIFSYWFSYIEYYNISLINDYFFPYMFTFYFSKWPLRQWPDVVLAEVSWVWNRPNTGLDINHWLAGPAGVFHSGGQSGQWTKESAGPKGPAIISSDHKVFVLHWPEV